jgi:hypothetical protein
MFIVVPLTNTNHFDLVPLTNTNHLDLVPLTNTNHLDLVPLTSSQINFLDAILTEFDNDTAFDNIACNLLFISSTSRFASAVRFVAGTDDFKLSLTMLDIVFFVLLLVSPHVKEPSVTAPANIAGRHIMSVTGHKSESNLKTYTGYTSNKTKKTMSSIVSDSLKSSVPATAA